MIRPHFRLLRRFHPSWFLLVCVVSACSPTSPQPRNMAESKKPGAARKSTPLPEFMADPYERLNRGMWEVNKGLLAGVIQPTGKVYRAVVPKPVRGSIKDFTRNITYPGRVVNTCCKGGGRGRVTNPCGFFATPLPVSRVFRCGQQMEHPEVRGHFGQTFTRWGWKPRGFVMLPFLGPSDDGPRDRNSCGQVGETMELRLPLSICLLRQQLQRSERQEQEARRLAASESDSYERSNISGRRAQGRGSGLAGQRRARPAHAANAGRGDVVQPSGPGFREQGPGKSVSAFPPPGGK